MDSISVLKKCFAILQLCSYSIAFIGYMQNKKVSKEHEKAYKEAVTKQDLIKLLNEFPKIIMTGRKLVLIGVIAGTIFGMISILL